MSLHRQEMGLRPVLNTHVSSGTSSRAWNFRTISSLPFVLWPHRLSRVSLLSLRRWNLPGSTIVHDTCPRNCFRQARQARRTRPIRTPCLCRRLEVPAVTLPVVVYRLHVRSHQLFSAELSLKPLQCLRILVAFPLRLDVHVSSHPFCPHWAQQPSFPDWRIRFSCSDLSSSRFACAGSFSIRAVILARHSSV